MDYPGERPAVNGDGVVALTRELVRVPSVNDPGRGLNEAPAAAVVETAMLSFGWSPVVEEVEPGRPNVVATIDGGLPGPTLMFEGHTDVVTEGDLSDWSRDPFGAEIADGRLYGRGSADMKGGVAAMIHAVAAIDAAGPFPGRIVLAVLCDEEEMMIGVKHLVASGMCEGVDAVIVCEPEGGEVCTSHKGAIRLLVHGRGVMAHGAMPHEGRNPVAALGLLLCRLADLETDLQSRVGEHPHLGLPFITPTHVAAGSRAQLNVIPAEATAAVDVRTTPGIDHSDLLTQVEGICASVGAETGVDLQASVVDDRPCTLTPNDDPVVQAIFEAHQAVTGEEPRYGGVPGSTDGTVLWADAGLPVVVYGPGGKWIAHQANEFVEIDDLMTAADVYVDAALRFLYAPTAEA